MQQQKPPQIKRINTINLYFVFETKEKKKELGFKLYFSLNILISKHIYIFFFSILCVYLFT
jgi:hypothetical protein